MNLFNEEGQSWVLDDNSAVYYKADSESIGFGICNHEGVYSCIISRIAITDFYWESDNLENEEQELVDLFLKHSDDIIYRTGVLIDQGDLNHNERGIYLIGLDDLQGECDS